MTAMRFLRRPTRPSNSRTAPQLICTDEPGMVFSMMRDPGTRLTTSDRLEKAFRRHKHPVGASWRMDETYIKVKGVWKYLYRAVDKQGKTIDLLLTAKRDKTAALRFFDKAMKVSGAPEKVTMDRSGANKAAVDAINARGETPILIRQVEYLNNIVEQNHRAIKPMLTFKSFSAARCVLAGIELMHMVRKGQWMIKDGYVMSFADQFYALASQIRSV